MSCLCRNASAQYYFYDDQYYDSPILFEAGPSLNIMNCLTDIGGRKGIGKKFVKDLNLGKTTVGGGVFFSATFKNAFALRMEAAFGKIQASDDVLKGITDIAFERYNRNLNFRTNITELSLVAELHPMFLFINWEGKDVLPPRYSPYLLGGVGYYSFNPQGLYEGKWIDLQPLSTEGQGIMANRPTYSLRQMNLPLGIGVRYELSPLLNIRGEFVYRKLFTDYLDDVSTNYVDPSIYDAAFDPDKAFIAKIMSDRQITKRTGVGGIRGSAKEKDAFFSFNIKLSLIIGRERIK